MRKPCLLLGSLLVLLFTTFIPVALAQGTGSFTSITAPAAGMGAQQGTTVLGIDTAGDVAGNYTDANGVSHGLLYFANGTLTPFDISGATTVSGQGTFVTAMDAGGDVSGYYYQTTSTIYGTGWIVEGFIRTAVGAVTTFNLQYDVMHNVFGINSAGAVTGAEYADAGDAFIRTADGTITYFSVSGNTVNGTQGIAINSSGVVAGRYVALIDPQNGGPSISHGFVRAASGTITTFDPPNVATTGTHIGNGGTMPFAIDTAGDIVGSYTDLNGARHSFLRSASGSFTTFDPPGTDTGACPTSNIGSVLCGSGALGMNDAGQIVGAYFDSDGVAHGYLRAASGSYTTFDIPGAGAGSYTGTAAFSINASGTIAGTYIDANSVMHGFVGTTAPAPTTAKLAASQSAIVFNEPASFTATISSSFGTPPDGEAVYFSNGMTQLGSSTLSKGVASFTTTSLPVGTNSVTAAYGGDSDFAGSTSKVVSQTVGKAISFTTLTASPNPSTSQQPVTLTAGLSGQFGGLVTGTVTFSNGSTALGTANVSANSAVLATSALPAGTDSITAGYSGDTNFGASTSNTVSQVVTAPSMAATPSFSPAAGTYTAAQSVTISDSTTGATVYYTTDGTTPTTGSAVYGGPIPVNSTETIEAIAAASEYSTGAVAMATYTIPQSFGLSMNPASMTVTAGASGTSQIKVQDEGGFNGNVSFACSGLPAGATCSFSQLTVPTPLGVSYTTLTVNTPSTTAEMRRGSGGLFPGAALAVVVCCFGLRKRRRLLMLVLLAVGTVGLGVVSGCGGSGSGGGSGGGTQPVTSTVTVAGTSGTLNSTATFTLTVN